VWSSCSNRLLLSWPPANGFLQSRRLVLSCKKITAGVRLGRACRSKYALRVFCDLCASALYVAVLEFPAEPSPERPVSHG